MAPPFITIAGFYALLKKHGISDNENLNKAIKQAADSFRGLKRDDGSDVFTQHLLPMTALLIEYFEAVSDVMDIDVLVASLFHDILEDVQNIAPSTIGSTYGHSVLEIVQCLTKRKHGNRPGYGSYTGRIKDNRDYYQQISSAPIRAKLVKAADRLNNIQSAYTNPDRNKVANYIRETEEIYLPIFEELPYFYSRISQELTRLRKFHICENPAAESSNSPQQKDEP